MNIDNIVLCLFSLILGFTISRIHAELTIIESLKRRIDQLQRYNWYLCSEKDEKENKK